MPTSSEIRQQFIDFFVKKHGHTFVPSSPVVPHDDPTLLFANAGMNQFKPYFLGTQKPPFLRAVNTQKCIRAGGKHNDLDDVGKDTYHHTFFEMLGNWSFGDYFKKEAIAWAWELLTEVWKLDPTRLHVTVFEGDPENKVPRDDEAAECWKSVGVPPERIHLGNKKDNFWEMGDTGPCGPCTEIHYDGTPDKSGAKLVNQSSDQVIEIWNNVFIQFNRNADKSLTPLPAKHVDTGMGFERVTKILQGKSSNYDTDIFMPIFDAIQKVTKAPPYSGKMDDLKDTAYRVIGDHIRMAVFAVSDGARPGNKKRDAVLRSVIRRAVRFAYQNFGCWKPFLFKLVIPVVEAMGDAFPEIKSNQEKIQEVLWAEETDFLRTIQRGLVGFGHSVRDSVRKEVERKTGHKWTGTSGTRLGPITGHLKSGSLYFDPNERGDPLVYSFELEEPTGRIYELAFSDDPISVRKFVTEHCAHPPIIPAKDIFDLHTTDGFPPDLTRQMADERGLLVDEAGYKVMLAEHEKLSRGQTHGPIVTAVKGELPKTDDSPKYEAPVIDAKVLGWVANNEVFRSGKVPAGEQVAVLLDRTNFYAEQGGQVGDTGHLDLKDSPGLEFRVEDTQRLGDTVLHVGTLVSGELKVGDTVQAVQSTSRRIETMRNHTATHLLNHALRQVLGGDVEQKGSLVDNEKTRFDFSHDKPLQGEQLRRIEELVNLQIIRNQPVTAISMPLAEAKKIPGLRAVFGEKYPDPVRVVMIGAESPNEVTHDNSVEFCGGTHLPRTGTIGYFKIISQEGVAKGVRRITATTGRGSFEVLQRMNAVADELAACFNCRFEEIPTRIESLQEEVKKLQKQIQKGAAGDLNSAGDKLLDAAPTIGSSKLIVGEIPGAPVDQMRAQVDRLRQKAGSSLIVLGWKNEDGTGGFLAGVSDDLIKKGIKAGDIIKPVAEVVGGKGGGPPNMANAGCKDTSKLGEALKKALELGTAALAK